MIVRKWNVIPATIKVTIVFVKLSILYTLFFIILIYQTNQISLSLSRVKDNNMESDQRFIAKDVKYDSSSDRKGAICGIPSRHYSGCWICTTTIKTFYSFSHSLNLSNLSYYFCFAWHFFLLLLQTSQNFSFTCLKKNKCSISLIINTFQVNIFTSRKASWKSGKEGKMYHKIIPMIYVTCFMYWPFSQSPNAVYEVSRISLRLLCNLRISLSHTFGQGPKMSTLAHILIVDLGRHLEWFLELAPIEYIMLHILYIIIEL